MIYVGIDVSKDKHVCHIISDKNEIICDSYEFANSASGFKDFIKVLKASADNQIEKIKVGLESTGHYSENLVNYLKRLNLTVITLNPLSVHRFRKSKTLRVTKTDKSDARYIAELTMLENSNSYLDKSYHIQTLKSLTRYRYRLLKLIQPLKNRFRRVLQIIFPEFETKFNVKLNSTYALFSKYPGPNAILKAKKASLTKYLKEISHGRFTKKTDILINLASESIGTGNNGDIFELQQICEQIIFLENKRSDIEDKIKEEMDEIKSQITTIPGVGIVTGASILAEIGNISNFKSPEKIQAYAGMDPCIYQSGKYIAEKTPMGKKGSVYLRNAIYQATKAAFVTNDYMRAYVNKKRNQGKHFTTALSHGMKKMVRIIYSVLSNNKPYTEPSI